MTGKVSITWLDSDGTGGTDGGSELSVGSGSLCQFCSLDSMKSDQGVKQRWFGPGICPRCVMHSSHVWAEVTQLLILLTFTHL